MKKTVCLILALAAVFTPFIGHAAKDISDETAAIYPFEYAFEEYWYTDSAAFGDTIPARSALLMEADTGVILFSQDENARHPVASVTKIMSTLLVVEAIDEGKIKLDDVITVGEAAARMGGSQVYLEVGEQIKVKEMLKAVIVVSANDATVAFAEHIAGSEQSFVTMMNQRAVDLGMKDTHFANCHGLTEEGHYSSAYDVALMTRELLKHEIIFEYSTIWMDTFRNGTFGLANTNKLIRFYSGANGMKTGFTDAAKYCLSGTAKRDGMQLIAVVIGADSSDIRFASTKKLLDFGFANYKILVPEKEVIGKVTVSGGAKGYVEADYTPPSILVEKGKGAALTSTITIGSVAAPVKAGDIIGTAEYFIDDVKVATVGVVALEDDKEITFFNILGKIWKSIIAFI